MQQLPCARCRSTIVNIKIYVLTSTHHHGKEELHLCRTCAKEVSRLIKGHGKLTAK